MSRKRVYDHNIGRSRGYDRREDFPTRFEGDRYRHGKDDNFRFYKRTRGRDADDSRRGYSRDRRNYERRRSRQSRDRRSRSRSRSYSSSYDSRASSDIDDSVGHFLGNPGDIINGRYSIQKELGTGTFGKVFFCQDAKHQDYVAVKVIRSIKRYIDSAKIEADILSVVYKKQKDFGSSYCMKMTLLLGMRTSRSITLPIREGKQLCRLSSKYCPRCVKAVAGGVEFSTKNEFDSYSTEKTSIQVNVRGETKSILIPTATQIKVIDFGGATFDDDKDKSTIVNTRQYRGPEVSLELGWSFPSDIWSAGCIIAEIYSGDLLLPTHEDQEHFCMIERCMGDFPIQMIRDSPVGRDFFHRNGKSRIENLSKSSRKFLSEILPLKDYCDIAPGDKTSGLYELLKGLLRIDPLDRFTPVLALRQRFYNS